jgi:ABC-2 type transport system permease protein
MRFTYRLWIINTTLGPLIWLLIIVYTYLGIASPENIQINFRRFAVTTGFAGFLILGQTLFTFFMAINNRAGLSIERERRYGTLESIFVTPVSRFVMVTAESVFALFESGWMVVITLITASLMFGLSPNIQSPIAVVNSFVLTFIAMIALGVFFSGFYVLARSASPLSRSANYPIRFFTGVNFPVDALPLSLQYVSYVIPVTYGINAIRESVLEGATFDVLMLDLTALSIATIVCFLLGWLFLRKAESLAKINGTLYSY